MLLWTWPASRILRKHVLLREHADDRNSVCTAPRDDRRRFHRDHTPTQSLSGDRHHCEIPIQRSTCHTSGVRRGFSRAGQFFPPRSWNQERRRRLSATSPAYQLRRSNGDANAPALRLEVRSAEGWSNDNLAAAALRSEVRGAEGRSNGLRQGCGPPVTDAPRNRR